MPANLNKIFKAIADPTRREIFHALVVAATALPINQIAVQFDISRQGITKHIKTLEDAGLIAIESKGRERFCIATPQTLTEANKWLKAYEKFWDQQLGNLGDYLDQQV